MNEKLIYIGLGIFGILGPIAFPDYVMQMAVLWIMVLMATTWDITGGQMGYNSLGNITFFWCWHVCVSGDPGLDVLRFGRVHRILRGD
jgi:branched-chain amino acid transport system permease protein